MPAARAGPFRSRVTAVFMYSGNAFICLGKKVSQRCKVNTSTKQRGGKTKLRWSVRLQPQSKSYRRRLARASNASIISTRSVITLSLDTGVAARIGNARALWLRCRPPDDVAALLNSWRIDKPSLINPRRLASYRQPKGNRFRRGAI
jgi:hypothetical protein